MEIGQLEAHSKDRLKGWSLLLLQIVDKVRCSCNPGGQPGEGCAESG